MACKFYTTKDYHENSVETLGWELTVCNALYRKEALLRRITEEKRHVRTGCFPPTFAVSSLRIR